MSYPMWLRPDEVAEVEELTKNECWELLVAAPFGRLAVRVDGGVDIFPINFLAKDNVLYFRSAPGAKLMDIAHASSVAFEIDGSRRRTHWSVVIQGKADRMSLDSEIEASGVLELSTMTSSAKWNYLRLTPYSITGRRFKEHR